MQGSVYCSHLIDSQWQQLPIAAIIPVPDIIFIWHGVTADLMKFYKDCYAMATLEERDKAARFYHADNQTRYIIQHSILRLLLAKYTGVNPQDILFTYNENKKPYLAGNAVKSCFFNLSHSDDDFLIAIGPCELGVDIEQINTKRHWQDIASDYFSAAEVQYITSSSNPDKAFFLLWTRKEGFLKATGTGIDDNLHAIRALDGLHPIPVEYPAVNWLTGSFEVGPRFMGAVTYASSPQMNIWLLSMTDNFVSQLI